MQVELTASGYVHLPAEMARRFPAGTAIVLVRDGELWLMPVSHAGAGGLLLKVRNAKGDRSVLVQEFLPQDAVPGVRDAVWDDANHAWRIPLFSSPDGDKPLLLRPQPLGVFPGMAGFFLLPPVPDSAPLIGQLLQGRLPDEWPEQWRFFAAAIAGAGEADVLKRLPDGPEGHYNRFVLTAQRQDYERAKAVAAGDVALLLDAVAWRLGMCAHPPAVSETDGEVKAFLLATQAYARFQEKDWREGLTLLQEAAETAREQSPVFAARLFAEWAATQQMLGASGEEVIEGYRTALALLAPSPFREAEAELWFQLGTAYQGMAAGHLQAAHCYHEALKRYRKTEHPEAYALTHMNLALVYLAMPGKERGAPLRTAVAIQSLREALTVFQKETHPEYWASATVNLANALQHVPTSHPEENLWEAVALYEDVLSVRREEDDPIAYARVLANQGNALAHLGAFSRAVPRLEAACRRFLAHGEAAAAEAVADVLEEIARRQSAVRSNVLRVNGGRREQGGG